VYYRKTESVAAGLTAVDTCSMESC